MQKWREIDGEKFPSVLYKLRFRQKIQVINDKLKIFEDEETELKQNIKQLDE